MLLRNNVFIAFVASTVLCLDGPSVMSADLLENRYVFQKSLPICDKIPGPEVFSHPVEVSVETLPVLTPPVQVTTVQWKSRRDRTEMARMNRGELETWVDFGEAGKLMNLGGASPILSCGVDPSQPGGRWNGYGFEVSAVNAGQSRTLLRMEDRIDEGDSSIHASVRLGNVGQWADPAQPGKTGNGELLLPGSVSLVLSVSRDGENFVETARVSPMVSPGGWHTIELKKHVSGPARIRLELVFLRTTPAPNFPQGRGYSQLRLLDARLSGTLCIPDQANPGECL